MTYAPDFEGENEAVLYSVDALTGDYKLKVSFWSGEEMYRPKKIYHFGTHYIIDADAIDYRHITAINAESGLVRWELELDKDPFLRSREVDIVWSDSLVIIPLEEELQAYDLYRGTMHWSYDYTDDIDGIGYLNQAGAKSGSISFLSDDNEFIDLNIISRRISFQENINFDGMVRIQYLDENNVLAYKNTGYISLFEKNATGVQNIWTSDVGAIESLIFSGENIHVFSPDNYSAVNFQDGKVSEKVPFIWMPNNIFIDDNYLGCFTGKKLYLINL